MKRKSVRSREYTGELNQPIKLKKHVGSPPRPPTILSMSENAQLEYEQRMQEYERRCRDYVLDQHVRKLGLLMDYYSIEDKTDYKSLAIHLAVNLVPGFSVSTETSGAKEIWNPCSLAKLYLDIERIREKSRIKTIQHACKKLVNEPLWKEFTGGGSEKLFVNKYADAKKSPIILLCEEACKVDPLNAEEYWAGIDNMFADYFKIKLPPQN